jgi:flagellar biogenesis protein FliO
MPIPLIVWGAVATAGAGAAGWAWWTSEEEEVSFEGELWKVLRPLIIVIVIILLLRWLYLKGSKNKK